MKKIFLMLLLLAGAPAVHAQPVTPEAEVNTVPVVVPALSQTPTQGSGQFVPLAPIDGLTKGVVADSQGLANFLRNLYRFLVGIAATLAVIEIVIGGIQYSTQDIPNAKSNGKERIWNAILGLIMVLSPVLVFSLINPAILNLSIQLPPLDTKNVVLPSSTAKEATLSETDRTLREQDGRKVLFTFELTNVTTMSPAQRAKVLDEQQNKCTQASGGLGIILPNQVMGGGANQYVCQTCGTGLKPTLFAAGRSDLGPRGACQ